MAQSVMIHISCRQRNKCIFGKTCNAVNGPTENFTPDFTPIMELRTVRLRYQLRCKSLKLKETGEQSE